MKRLIADGSNAGLQAEAAIVRMMDACMRLEAKARRFGEAIERLNDAELRAGLFDSSPLQH